MVSNCLWSLDRGHCASNLEVRAEITYAGTISLQNCSSHHHRKRVHKAQSHLRFETLHSSVSKKSLTISRFLTLVKVQSRVAACSQKMMSQNPAIGLEFGCFHCCCPSAIDSPRQGWGGLLSAEGCPATLGFISVRWSLNRNKSTVPLKTSMCSSRGPVHHLSRTGFSRRTYRRWFQYGKKQDNLKESAAARKYKVSG